MVLLLHDQVSSGPTKRVERALLRARRAACASGVSSRSIRRSLLLEEAAILLDQPDVALDRGIDQRRGERAIVQLLLDDVAHRRRRQVVGRREERDDRAGPRVAAGPAPGIEQIAKDARQPGRAGQRRRPVGQEPAEARRFATARRRRPSGRRPRRSALRGHRAGGSSRSGSSPASRRSLGRPARSSLAGRCRRRAGRSGPARGG